MRIFCRHCHENHPGAPGPPLCASQDRSRQRASDIEGTALPIRRARAEQDCRANPSALMGWLCSLVQPLLDVLAEQFLQCHLLAGGFDLEMHKEVVRALQGGSRGNADRRCAFKCASSSVLCPPWSSRCQRGRGGGTLALLSQPLVLKKMRKRLPERSRRFLSAREGAVSRVPRPVQQSWPVDPAPWWWMPDCPPGWAAFALCSFSPVTTPSSASC